ncbi:MAG: ArsR family transcriptional regulator [Steroidobacteraceae bacterium]
MNEIFGESRSRLLRHLLRNKTGASVDELAAAVEVTRTAVRQHLAALMRDGLVARGTARPTGGRPRRLFVLTHRGKETFPRNYSWFARLLVEEIAHEHGAAGLRTRLGRIASAVVAQLPQPVNAPGRRARIKALCEAMDRLGYDTRIGRDGVGTTIEADNCVFHELAQRHPEICHFDLALLSGYSGERVDLQECMARGGRVCRFRFTPRR